MNNATATAYRWASEKLMFGETAVDHLLIAMSAAMTLMALGCAVYNMWQAGMRVTCMIGGVALSLLFAQMTVDNFRHVYPNGSAIEVVQARTQALAAETKVSTWIKYLHSLV